MYPRTIKASQSSELIIISNVVESIFLILSELQLLKLQLKQQWTGHGPCLDAADLHRSFRQYAREDIKSSPWRAGSTNSRSYDAQGRELAGNTGGGSARITDVSDSEQAKRDAEYEERMEDE